MAISDKYLVATARTNCFEVRSNMPILFQYNIYRLFSYTSTPSAHIPLASTGYPARRLLY